MLPLFALISGDKRNETWYNLAMEDFTRVCLYHRPHPTRILPSHHVISEEVQDSRHASKR